MDQKEIIEKYLYYLWKEGRVMRTTHLMDEDSYGWIPSSEGVFRDGYITYEIYLKNQN